MVFRDFQKLTMRVTCFASVFCCSLWALPIQAQDAASPIDFQIPLTFTRIHEDVSSVILACTVFRNGDARIGTGSSDIPIDAGLRRISGTFPVRVDTRGFGYQNGDTYRCQVRVAGADGVFEPIALNSDFYNGARQGDGIVTGAINIQ